MTPLRIERRLTILEIVVLPLNYEVRASLEIESRLTILEIVVLPLNYEAVDSSGV